MSVPDLSGVCAAIRVAISNLFAGRAYSLRLDAVLLTLGYGRPVFRLGAGSCGHCSRCCRRLSFLRAHKPLQVEVPTNADLPLIGCAIGATVFYVFGAMLIAFGMFGVGGLAVVLTEVMFLKQGQGNTFLR